MLTMCAVGVGAGTLLLVEALGYVVGHLCKAVVELRVRFPSSLPLSLAKTWLLIGGPWASVRGRLGRLWLTSRSRGRLTAWCVGRVL